MPLICSFTEESESGTHPNSATIRKDVYKLMKKKLADLFRNRKIAAGVTAIVLAVAVGSTAVVQQKSQIPELPSYTDPVLETTIEEEETPLASAPKVNTTTSKKISSKKVTMKSAAKKTYTKTLPAKSTTSRKTSETSSATVTTQTTVVKKSKEAYTKKSKVKVVTTETTTTVTTTTTAKAAAATTAQTATASGNTVANGTVDVSKIAPKADSRVITAYRTLGFTVEVNSSVSYSGYFDARNQKITVKKADDTIYHELGHFVAFVAGNADQTAEFKAIFSQEKALYTAYNKSYVTQNSAEYFAESVKEFTLNPAALKSARPKTYEAVKEAMDKLTDDRVAKVKKVYSMIWK